MIKKDIFNHDVKARFQASAKERLYRFLMADDQIKGVVVHATRMIKEMQANHDLGPLETLVLGQAYIAATLMSAPLKGRDKIAMNIQCSGPIKGLDVKANAFGEICGYLKANPIQVKNPQKIKRLSTLYGAGFLSVTRYISGDTNQPYTGQIALVHGSIAEDLAEYFLTSEQIPSGFKLSVAFDENENIIGAGGIFLQALPGAQPDNVVQAETMINGIDALGHRFALNQTPESIIETGFADLSPRFLDSSRVEFYCRCAKDRMADHLKNLPKEDRTDILANGPFPLELRCHHCNSVYRFSQKELTGIFNLI
ncbi:Hsp33 family molecular chaperone HslO [Desulfobacter latus]|uniref:Hsp33 family molecular chaperone HslO n=1 Tax=Desulfobacter latus TaxID=2292 RepID=A0A850T3G1_9BACT|nr:Hsp33 family molecular chaperone HslO [Desulfobacter latus]NWH05631.1 Hsp33 family molecular chaperone HslO [Desulfobacter latus]